MSSKETHVCHWEMRTALRHLITDTTLSFNQCITCNQELAVYQPLRVMMDNIPCLNKSRDKLDKHHLITHQWVNKVIVTARVKESNAILNIILSMLSFFF